MARNSKDGKESDVTKKLVAEEEQTAKAQAVRDEENKAEEARKAELAKEEADKQTDPRAVVVPVENKERKLAWEKHLKSYADKNPAKFAEKKARGEFDDIPDSFTGTNVLNIQG